MNRIHDKTIKKEFITAKRFESLITQTSEKETTLHVNLRSKSQQQLKRSKFNLIHDKTIKKELTYTKRFERLIPQASKKETTLQVNLRSKISNT